MRRFRNTFLSLTLLVVPCLAQFKFTTVDFPEAPQTELIAVNDTGQYVGASIDANQTSHAIFFDGETFSLLDPTGVVGTNPSFALSLNLRGDIVGGYTDGSGVNHGFLYNAGNVTTIDFPGAAGTFAFGINDRREIIGVYTNANSQIQHAFLLKKGAFTNIDLPNGIQTIPFSINDFTEIVGQFSTATSGPAGHGYLELKNKEFQTFDAPDAPPNSTFFISINNVNQILGAWIDANNVTHNFLLSFGRLLNFNLPKSFGATNVSGQTLNDSGEIVGFYFDAQNLQHGFIAIPKDGKPAH